MQDGRLCCHDVATRFIQRTGLIVIQLDHIFNPLPLCHHGVLRSLRSENGIRLQYLIT